MLHGYVYITNWDSFQFYAKLNARNLSNHKKTIMKKLFFSLCIFTFLISTLSAQNSRRTEAMAKVKEYRVVFFTKSLELTPKEAKAFWPIYNDYQTKKEEIKKRGDRRHKVELMNDAEVETYLIDHLDNEQKLLDLKKDFFRQVKTVLPIRKVAIIPKVEQQFRKEILSEMRKRRQEGRGGRQRGN